MRILVAFKKGKNMLYVYLWYRLYVFTIKWVNSDIIAIEHSWEIILIFDIFLLVEILYS